MDYEPRERISNSTRMAMIMVAIAFWLISFIPIINVFTNTAGWVTMWMWFKVRGASLTKHKGKNISSAVAGFIPLVGTLISAFPVVIYFNIRDVQKEDTFYNNAQLKNINDSRALKSATIRMTRQLNSQDNRAEKQKLSSVEKGK